MKTKLFSVELSDQAEIDFDRSYEYYLSDSVKLADTFLKSVNVSFENITLNPYSFPIVYKNVRKYVLRKFPFVIYYRVVDPIIQVIAIFHTSRDPEIWNSRV